MKKLKKIMLTSGVMLALSTGVVTSYLMAQQPRTPQEDLTLANVELLASPCRESIEIEGPIITVVVCNRSTGFFDYFMNTPCGSEDTGSCSFTNQGKA